MMASKDHNMSEQGTASKKKNETLMIRQNLKT
jgi:hypothetical protein